MKRWANAAPNRAPQQESKRQAIIREAARIVSRRGCHGATPDDVAGWLGANAAPRRYVRNKNDLAFACHEEAMEIAERTLTESERAGRDGQDRAPGSGGKEAWPRPAGYLSPSQTTLGRSAMSAARAFGNYDIAATGAGRARGAGPAAATPPDRAGRRA